MTLPGFVRPGIEPPDSVYKRDPLVPPPRNIMGEDDVTQEPFVPTHPIPHYPGVVDQSPPPPGLIPPRVLEKPAAVDAARRDPDTVWTLAKSTVPWLPRAAMQVWVQAYLDTGDAALALAEVRADKRYERWFPGNKREDGSLVYDEGTYRAHIEGYEDAILGIGLNPALFRRRYSELISGLVSAGEFRARINEAYDRIIDAAPSVRQAYREFGFLPGSISDEAIVASLIDGDIGQAVLSGQMDLAEVSAEAYQRGFGFQTDLTRRFVQANIMRQGASQFFAQAQEDLPILNRLIARHEDPNDPLDLEEFAEAIALNTDPRQRQQIRRVLAAESSLFSAASTFATNQQGITGLQPL